VNLYGAYRLTKPLTRFVSHLLNLKFSTGTNISRTTPLFTSQSRLYNFKSSQ